MLLIQNAYIKPITGPDIPGGCLLADGGRIAAIAPHIDPPYRTINNASVAADASVRPLRLTARFYNTSAPSPDRSPHTPPQTRRR